MTETTKTVFEKYQVRKNKKQKAAFRDYVKTVAEENECQYREEKGYLGAKNIVIGDPDNAKVIYTAHYDTCARLPFPNFITPKSFLIYLLYQIVLVIGMFAVISILEIPSILFDVFLLDLALEASFPVFLLFLISSFILRVAPPFVVLCLFFCGPANKHTANDNTSGVTVLLDLMTSMNEEEKSKCALVFFDLEEAGLFGSAGFANKHKNVMKKTLLINFDCVSDGENMLFVLRKGAIQFQEIMEECFQGTDDIKVEFASKGTIYPSDQANFKKGVGVAALKKTKGGLLYMNKIHTDKDRVYREENIEYLSEKARKLLEKF